MNNFRLLKKDAGHFDPEQLTKKIGRQTIAIIDLEIFFEEQGNLSGGRGIK